MNKAKSQTGFTIIELLIATTIFSIVLMVILAAFLQIGRMFYKGVSVDNTQEAARSIVEDITNDAKLSLSYTNGGAYSSSARYFCLGQHRYIYNLNYAKVTDTNITSPSPSSPTGVIVSTIGGGCPAPNATPGTNVQQLLGPDMQLNDMTITALPGNMYRVHVHIIFYGFDNTIFYSPTHPTDTPAQAIRRTDARCVGNLLSTQFCAMADLDTTVATRE